jgi:exosortase
VIAQVTLKLKFFVSAAATMAINAMGIHAVQQGSYIYTNHSILIVGDPCSGLRSFLAFLTLGFVFAYDEKLNFTKRSLIVFTGLPLAIISNICRVIFLTLVGEIYGMQYTGPGALPHDISGIAVFVIAFLVFMVLKQKLETKHEALS